MTNLIGQSLGRYHILEQLGEGGMATVYKAYDTRLERDVAVKLIRKSAFSEEVLERMLRRFDREAKALAKLTHPNIVSIIDYGEFEGSPYLIMPYLPGGTLKQHLGKPISWQESARLLTPIARALQYAHEQGIVHRDIKPSNILITKSGEPMLSDFGIAKVLDNEEATNLTMSGTGVGTPEYMAPEQWTGQATAQSDIYSLGVVFYEMVAGRKPYMADTPPAIMLKQATDPLPSPTQFAPDLPERVEKILLKVLGKQPENRYQSMGEFAVAMEGLLEMRGEAAKGAGEFAAPRTAATRMLDRDDPSITFAQTESQAIILQDTKQDEAVLILAERDGIPPLSNPPPMVEIREKKSHNRRAWVIWVIGAAIILFSAMFIWLYAPKGNIIPLGIGSTWTRTVDGMVMVYVPAGTFTMGDTADQAMTECQKYQNDCQQVSFTNEQPPHSVNLDAYWIDKTDVTNAMYALCVKAEVCQAPSQYSSYAHSIYYGTPEYDNYPVIFVNWMDANAYCSWAGARLPTEAEWEKAARGTDERIYPWGNGSPDKSLLNFNINVGDTSAVGSYPSGASLYGAVDMAGNVWQWVNDWFDLNYYTNSPSSNPPGPTSGTSRVLRGGSWDVPEIKVRAAGRNAYVPTEAHDYLGFRCARSQP